MTGPVAEPETADIADTTLDGRGVARTAGMVHAVSARVASITAIESVLINRRRAPPKQVIHVPSSVVIG